MAKFAYIKKKSYLCNDIMDLKEKSETTLFAANQLLTSCKDTYATQSVHGLYYSVLQFMMYILANAKTNQISYEQQMTDGGDNSHKYLYEKILLMLDFTPADKRRFSEDFRILKRARVEADYSTGTFTMEQALDYGLLADRLRALLKRVSNDKIKNN